MDETVTIHAAKTNLSRLVARAEAGEEIIIARGRTLGSIGQLLAEPLEECVLAQPDGRPCLEAITPVDLQQQLRLPGGHIFHRDLSWPFAEHDHEIGTWGVETEHPSILLCGAGARRGGCVSGIPGHNAARAVLCC